MEKNVLNKVSTVGIVVAIAALVSLSGAFGTSADSSTAGYGYGATAGYDYGSTGGSVQKIGDFDLKKEDTKKDEDKKEDTKKDEDKKENTKKDEDKKENTKKDRIVKNVDGKIYNINNKECKVCEDINNPNYNSSKVVTFTDVATSPFAADIIRLARVTSTSGKAIVVGTTPTTFEPARGITRAEFLAISLASHGIDVSEVATSTPFADLKIGDWKTNVVAAALKEGIIAGDSRNGTKVFRPNDQISKIEALAILTSMRDIQINPEYKHSYKDAAATWQDRVLSIVEYLELDPKSDKFNPNSTIRRDAMTHYIVETVKYY